MRAILDSIEHEYRRYKLLAERAMAQLQDADLAARPVGGGNSIAIIVRHLAGNFRSRYTDFPDVDGEKPWRDRDDEFVPREMTRGELLEEWNHAWSILFAALSRIDDGRLHDRVTIRTVPLSITEALHRSLSHAAYHVGQIVLIAKCRAGDGWEYLSIPPGGTAAYNQHPTAEKPPR